MAVEIEKNDHIWIIYCTLLKSEMPWTNQQVTRLNFYDQIEQRSLCRVLPIVAL